MFLGRNVTDFIVPIKFTINRMGYSGEFFERFSRRTKMNLSGREKLPVYFDPSSYGKV